MLCLYPCVYLHRLRVAGTSEEEEDRQLLQATDPSLAPVPASYTGPTLSLPLTATQVEALVDAFSGRRWGVGGGGGYGLGMDTDEIKIVVDGEVYSVGVLVNCCWWKAFT